MFKHLPILFGATATGSMVSLAYLAAFSALFSMVGVDYDAPAIGAVITAMALTAGYIRIYGVVQRGKGYGRAILAVIAGCAAAKYVAIAPFTNMEQPLVFLMAASGIVAGLMIGLRLLAGEQRLAYDYN